MVRLSIQLPDDVRQLAESRAKESGHTTLEEYVEALVRVDTGEPADPQLEALLERRLDSGSSIEANDAFWADLKRRVKCH